MYTKPTFEVEKGHWEADAYRVTSDRNAVAWRVLGWETQPGPTEWLDKSQQSRDELGRFGRMGVWVFDEEPEPVRTGKVVCIMVGDDRRFLFEPEDLEPLDDEDYCTGCGQIGCGWC